MSVIDSVHNLSVSGNGTVKATTESEICIFCHTPHRSGEDTPLWNHRTSVTQYTLYSSPTMNAKVGQPNGASKLCLSCHDGTVALGMVYSQATPIEMQNGVSVMPAGPTNVGTDLSQDHPISFTYDSALASADGKLVDPKTLTNKVRLDHQGQMQCTSCHDPHDNQFGNFLVIQPNGADLCNTCHTSAGSTTSAHGTSTASIVPAAATALVAATSAQTAQSLNARASSAKIKTTQKVKTVAANGCNNCHATHGAGGRKRLLLHAQEEQTCFACHNGTVDRQNLEVEFKKPSIHPVIETSKLHEAAEDPINGPRHVACSDCHNSHAAKKSNAHGAKTPTTMAPAAGGPLAEVKGINRSGSMVKAVTYEYELCFRCHGDGGTHKPATVNRVTAQPNTRLQFSQSNASFHPVVGVGKNVNVPSLITPYTATSTIRCSDCHNNDQGPGAGGSGPNGPHGSNFAPLLERRLDTTDEIVESPASYALCYKCHSRDSILGDQSFRATDGMGKDRGHRFHIVEQKAACTTCHDSHGVAANKHLINFNPDYVRQSSTGKIEYKSTGFQSGNCTLTCHGANHVNAAYPQQTVLAAPAAPRRK